MKWNNWHWKETARTDNLDGRSIININGGHFTWCATAWSKRTQLVFFSQCWEKWICLRKGLFTRRSYVIWAVAHDQNYRESIRNTLGCLVTTEQWTKDWDVRVTIFLVPLLLHPDSFWPHLSQPSESKPMMKWFVSIETTKPKCLLRLEKNLYAAEENKNSVMDKLWSQVYPFVFLESTWLCPRLFFLFL